MQGQAGARLTWGSTVLQRARHGGAPAHGVPVTGVPYVPQILEQQREEAGLVLTEGSGRAGAARSRVDGDGLAAELGRSSRRKVL